MRVGLWMVAMVVALGAQAAAAQGSAPKVKPIPGGEVAQVGGAMIGSQAPGAMIYDTFNEDHEGVLFDCCNVLAVNGAHSLNGVKELVAVPFKVDVYTKLAEVDVALSWLGGDNELAVRLVGSTMGLPGRVKQHWGYLHAEGIGQCCDYMKLLPRYATAMAGGGTYWIVLEAAQKTAGGWNGNTLGLEGPYATSGADGVWTMTSGVLPAVRVVGK